MVKERTIKDDIKDVLERFGCYYLMPVQFGYGAAGLDFHCCVPFRGWAIAFFIEAKKPGKPRTPRQDKLREELITKQKARVFTIDDVFTLKELEKWLLTLQQKSNDRQS
jgi:hypothetical protein